MGLSISDDKFRIGIIFEKFIFFLYLRNEYFLLVGVKMFKPYPVVQTGPGF